MPPVHPMEFSPLIGRERPQERMIHELRFDTKPAFAFLQARIHLLDLGKDHRKHVLGWYALRDGSFWGFPPAGQMAETDHHQGAEAMLHGGCCGRGSAGLKAFGDPSVRVLVSEVEVFKNLGRIPFPGRSLGYGSFRQASCHILKFATQALKMSVHNRVQYNDRKHRIRGICQIKR